MTIFDMFANRGEPRAPRPLTNGEVAAVMVNIGHGDPCLCGASWEPGPVSGQRVLTHHPHCPYTAALMASDIFNGDDMGVLIP